MPRGQAMMRLRRASGAIRRSTRAVTLVGSLCLSLVGCVTHSTRFATSRGPYIREVPVAREIAISTLMREVARRGLQMSSDRAAGLITVPNVALPESQFDCNLLLRDGVPAYRIVTAV